MRYALHIRQGDVPGDNGRRPVRDEGELSARDATTARVVAVALLVWFLAVAGVGHAGLLVGAPAALVGGYVVGVTTLLCVLAISLPALRGWLCGLPLRGLVLLHFVRFIGVSFLVSSGAPGGLPDRFAVPAGYGDVFAAITALVLAVGFLPAVTRSRRRLLLAWNVLGLADLLLAVGTGVSIQLSGGTAMAPIVTAPLMYVPFYFVPLLLFVHLVIFYRLAVNELGSEVSSGRR
jgi:hypothetical protein